MRQKKKQPIEKQRTLYRRAKIDSNKLQKMHRNGYGKLIKMDYIPMQALLSCHYLVIQQMKLLVKNTFMIFFIPEKRDELKKAAFEVFSRREAFRHFENTNVHKDGRVLILTTSGSPIFDDKGNFVGFRGVDSDITERKKMLEELVLAKEKAEESDKLKTSFYQQYLARNQDPR